jgi:hypothetical protein
MKYLTAATFALVIVISTSTANAAETKCKGDALREKPPIPNHPTHIRNVVWRNTRAMCLQELSQRSMNIPNSNTAPAQPITK